MKKFLAVGLSAIALVAAAAPACAATDLGTVALSDSNPGPDFFSFFSFFNPSLAAGDYTIKYTFGFPITGSGAGDVSASLVGGDNTSFNSVDLNGSAFILNADHSLGSVEAAPIFGLPMSNVLTANFNVLRTGVAAFNGSVSASAVPEPVTWAMMLLGFGMIGFALRRSPSKMTTRIRYSMG